MRDRSPLQPEHLVFEAPIMGEIGWGSWRLRCPDCDATAPWAFRVQQRPYTNGEDAWAVCPLQHTVKHPLIYPEFVRALIDWCQADTVHWPDPHDSLQDVLSKLEWRPHRKYAFMSESAHMWHEVWYTPWDAPGGGTDDYWQRSWPDVWAAAKSPTT